MVEIWACDRLMVAEPLPAPRRSLGTWKVSLPILITAICWPLEPVFSPEIAPMVAPVLSFTGSPTERLAAALDEAVALVSAAAPPAGAALPFELASGDDDVAGGAAVCELGVADCIEPPAAVWLAARAEPDIATAMPAAMKSAERMFDSPGSCSPAPFPT